MMNLGDFRLGDTFDLKFCTVTTTGAPTQLAGSPVISAYPGNSTTELTAGITLTVDFDARTGLNNVRVVASSGNGYATATNYALVITTGTVGGTSVVGYVIGHFSIEARSALIPTVAARTLDVSATGEAGVDWANVGSPTTANNLTGTNIKTDQVVASVTGAVGSVTGSVGTISNTGIDGILDRAAGVETNYTLRQALRLILSSAAAKLSGAATTTVVIRDINDTKARITATVDANGNRSAISTDVT